MSHNKKLAFILITCGLVSLISGCEKTESEEVGNTLRKHPPIQVALDAMGKNFQDSVTNLIVTQSVNRGEFPDSAVVTVEETGLLDDSIAAAKTEFSMKYQEGQWKIINQVKTHRCHPERGHQDFSEQPCR